VVAEAAKTRGLPALDRLNDQQARPVVARALGSLMTGAHAPCKPPALAAPITHKAPRLA
jgi:hypothetical protein